MKPTNIMALNWKPSEPSLCEQSLGSPSSNETDQPYGSWTDWIAVNTTIFRTLYEANN